MKETMSDLKKKEKENVKLWIEAKEAHWDEYFNYKRYYVVHSPKSKYNPNVTVVNGCPMEKK